MLQFYLSTVAIYAIIILCVVKIFKDSYKKNMQYISGENSKKAKLTERYINLFVLSAVPILRLFVVVLIVFIATAKNETLDEMKSKVEERKSS